MARRFPVRIGRAAAADLRLEEDGIWDEHLLLAYEAGQGITARTVRDALARLNGEPVAQSEVRNGDILELGSVKLEFWLNEARQRSLRLIEVLTWGGIAAVTIAQIALVYCLAR